MGTYKILSREFCRVGQEFSYSHKLGFNKLWYFVLPIVSLDPQGYQIFGVCQKFHLFGSTGISRELYYKTDKTMQEMPITNVLHYDAFDYILSCNTLKGLCSNLQNHFLSTTKKHGKQIKRRMYKNFDEMKLCSLALQTPLSRQKKIESK